VRRNSDDLEIEFIWPEQLKYSKKGEIIIFSCDAHIHSDGAPDGFVVYIKNQKISADRKLEIEADLHAAANSLKTNFYFE
jgi:formylmethanofuran dehydrogenase subunit C